MNRFFRNSRTWLWLIPLVTLALTAKDSHNFRNMAWMLSAPNAPVFQVLDTESSLEPYAGAPKTITLKDLVHLHGHPCDGLVLAACALRMAFKELYPAGVIDRTDTGVITNNSPCFGDAAAYLTGGRIRFGTQKIDPKMGNEFIVHRFSTGKTVRISLKADVFPEKLEQMEARLKHGTPTLADVRKCQAIQLQWIQTLLNTKPARLFDVQELHNFTWIPDKYEHTGPRGDVRMKTTGKKPAFLATKPLTVNKEELK